MSKSPCRRVRRSEPFDRLREGFDRLSPNGFWWRMLRFVANQVLRRVGQVRAQAEPPSSLLRASDMASSCQAPAQGTRPSALLQIANRTRCRTGNATEPWLPPVKDVRRLFMLIFEGWIPQDRFTSRGCLRSRVWDRAAHLRAQAPNNVDEDSPVAAAAPRSPSGRECGCRCVPPFSFLAFLLTGCRYPNGPSVQWGRCWERGFGGGGSPDLVMSGRRPLIDQPAFASSATPFHPERCTSRPIAHTNPASSRAIATTALVFISRRATSRLNV